MTDERIKEEFGLFMARSVPIRDVDLSRTLTGSVGDFDNIMIQSHAVGFIGGFRTAERLAKIEAADRFCASCHGKEDGMCGECPDRAAILNSPVKEYQ